VHGQQACPAEPGSQCPINNGLLIFLDDLESDTAPYVMHRIGVASHTFLGAFLQQAGPIIVSASILDNVKEYEKPKEQDPLKLIERQIAIVQKFPHIDDNEAKEIKSIFLAAISFNKTTAQAWIIKKINDALYLLLPKQYLQSRNVSETEVQAFISADDESVTSVEQQLGLKVNHMETVMDIDTIKKPLPEPPFATYFIPALWNTERQTSSIFVTNQEYYRYKQNTIPTWSILINGHGTLGGTIVGLWLEDFKQFLSFLQKSIHTKLLYYVSCYAAGINHRILYEDAQSRIDKTYPFAIITQALTDAPVTGVFIVPQEVQGQLQALSYIQYEIFLNKILSTEIINYYEIANYLNLEKFSIGGLPQIRFPGLAWFSVIDEQKVCSIGSILAKTRTSPLNIETFFARQGKSANPLGILLYAQDIPFELLINTKLENGLPPTMISMIPGNALHRIKKISSTVHDIDELLFSFTRIPMLAPEKVFIIDEVVGLAVITDKEGQTEKKPISMYDVVIHLTMLQDSIYLKLDNVLYTLTKTAMEKASPIDQTEYRLLFARCTPPQETAIPIEQITDFQTTMDTFFAATLPSNIAGAKIISAFNYMPNSMALRIPTIKGLPCPPENPGCWWDFAGYIAQQASFGTHKIIWVDRIKVCSEQDCQIILSDVIIDVDKEETIVYFTNPDQSMGMVSNIRGMARIAESYIPKYTALFNYFDQHHQLPASIPTKIPTTQELLTPEAIATIEKVQQKKVQQQKSSEVKKSSRTRKNKRHPRRK
jgi:hypothetical protein